jgi:hypothetical protein
LIPSMQERRSNGNKRTGPHRHHPQWDDRNGHLRDIRSHAFHVCN